MLPQTEPKKKAITPALVAQLATFVDKKDMSVPKLLEASIEFLKTVDPSFAISKAALDAQIKLIAVKEKRGDDKKPIWYLK